MRRRFDSLKQKLAKEKSDLAQEKSNASSYRTESLVSWAEAAMGLLGGRKRSLSSQLSKQRRAGDASARAEATEQNMAELQADIAELEAELNTQVSEITQRWDSAIGGITVDGVAPRRSDIKVDLIALAWAPSWNVEYSDGSMLRSRSVAAWK